MEHFNLAELVTGLKCPESSFSSDYYQFDKILKDFHRQAQEPQEHSQPVFNLPKSVTELNDKKNLKTQKSSFIDIQSFKVIELKAELKKRGLATSGLKKNLQKRLRNAINEESTSHGDDKDIKNNFAKEEKKLTVNSSETQAGDESEEISQVINMEVETLGDKSNKRNRSFDNKNDISNETLNINMETEENKKMPSKKFQAVARNLPDKASDDAFTPKLTNETTEDGMDVEIMNELDIDSTNEESMHINSENVDNGTRLSGNTKATAINLGRVSKEYKSIDSVLIINKKLDCMQVTSSDCEEFTKINCTSKEKESADDVLTVDEKKLPDYKPAISLISEDLKEVATNDIVTIDKEQHFSSSNDMYDMPSTQDEREGTSLDSQTNSYKPDELSEQKKFPGDVLLQDTTTNEDSATVLFPEEKHYLEKTNYDDIIEVSGQNEIEQSTGNEKLVQRPFGKSSQEEVVRKKYSDLKSNGVQVPKLDVEEEKSYIPDQSEVEEHRNEHGQSKTLSKSNQDEMVRENIGISKPGNIYNTSNTKDVKNLGLKSYGKGITMTQLSIPLSMPSVTSYGSKSASSTSSATSSSSSQGIKDKKDRLAAARKARLQEMRGQNKKAAISSNSAKKDVNSYNVTKIPPLKKKDLIGQAKRTPEISFSASASSYNKDTKLTKQQKPDIEREAMKKRIAAQMREKVASTAIKRATPKRPQPCLETPSRSKVKFHDDINILYPQKLEAHERSPMDTYEVSDRDDSSSDSDSSNDDKPQKKKPTWAQSENLKVALRKQVVDGPNKIDPDRIFGEVITCNLEEIFEMKKSRYKKRASSGNWTKDEITLGEKLNYKKDMGYHVN